MKRYDRLAYETSQRITLAYSSSFGTSSRLFDRRTRRHIYAIYALVRVADEIVDGEAQTDASKLLDNLEADTYAAIKSGYSTNPVVHAFALTARRFAIEPALVRPFFASMRLDLTPQTYTSKLYRAYIHGSAEVVGLMCLKVFCDGDDDAYRTLERGAIALGAAYQKVNFLRDLSADYHTLGRWYFPRTTYETFNNKAKSAIVASIRNDLEQAEPALQRLPRNVRTAVATSAAYYTTLLDKLDRASVETIKRRRLRVTNTTKLWLLGRTVLTEGLRR